MSDNTIHISFCTDSNYVMPTGVAMISVCENNKSADLFFHLVITDENNDKDVVLNKFQPLEDIAIKYHSRCKYYFIDSAELSSFECSGVEHVSTAGFARVFIPELLDSTISKVLYLDCDVVVNNSLNDLWDTILEDDCPFAAVTDANGGSAIYRRELQMPLTVEYYNSGVLLMNLDCWRNNDYTRKSIECASEHKFPFLDQDMLNYLFAAKVKSLPIKYNYQTLFEFTSPMYWMVDYKYVDEIKRIIAGDESPVIIHYISNNKPWKDEWCPRREIWSSYCSMSQWKDLDLAPVLTRFDRCLVYKDFIDAYWSDAKLMEELLGPVIKLQMTAARMKNKHLFIKMATTPLNIFAKLLSKVYELKKY